MKIITLIISLVGFGCLGCASVSMNPETGEISYYRMGDQQLQGFELVKGDLKVKLKGQQSEAEALTEAIKVIGILSSPK